MTAREVVVTLIPPAMTILVAALGYYFGLRRYAAAGRVHAGDEERPKK